MALTLDEVEILVIGPNVWGRAKNVKAAIANACNPKKYQVFICHKDTRVDQMGLVSYPLEYPPFEILRKGLTGPYKDGFIKFPPKCEICQGKQIVEINNKREPCPKCCSKA